MKLKDGWLKTTPEPLFILIISFWVGRLWQHFLKVHVKHAYLRVLNFIATNYIYSVL